MAETAKMDLDALKCIQMYIPQTGQKMPTNGKKWQKWPKIANNCKISEITKYGDKITKIDKDVQKCTKMRKTVKWQNLKKNHRFSDSKLPKNEFKCFKMH